LSSKNLINEFDEIVVWPTKKLDKEYIFKFLSKKFIIDRIYSEKEINQIIQKHHLFNDIPLIRRELVSRKILERTDTGSRY
tara:strand:+ start:224 stop:466 length:243 start_codon:yes stop_codon:yes gene_type:complete